MTRSARNNGGKYLLLATAADGGTTAERHPHEEWCGSAIFCTTLPYGAPSDHRRTRIQRPRIGRTPSKPPTIKNAAARISAQRDEGLHSQRIVDRIPLGSRSIIARAANRPTTWCARSWYVCLRFRGAEGRNPCSVEAIDRLAGCQRGMAEHRQPCQGRLLSRGSRCDACGLGQSRAAASNSMVSPIRNEGDF
jgi:hypothetical protein